MDWILIGVFFAACAIVNRWAFQKEAERAVRAAMQDAER